MNAFYEKMLANCSVGNASQNTPYGLDKSEPMPGHLKLNRLMRKLNITLIFWELIFERLL